MRYPFAGHIRLMILLRIEIYFEEYCCKLKPSISGHLRK